MLEWPTKCSLLVAGEEHPATAILNVLLLGRQAWAKKKGAGAMTLNFIFATVDDQPLVDTAWSSKSISGGTLTLTNLPVGKYFVLKIESTGSRKQTLMSQLYRRMIS